MSGFSRWSYGNRYNLSNCFYLVSLYKYKSSCLFVHSLTLYLLRQNTLNLYSWEMLIIINLPDYLLGAFLNGGGSIPPRLGVNMWPVNVNFSANKLLGREAFSQIVCSGHVELSIIRAWLNVDGYSCQFRWGSGGIWESINRAGAYLSFCHVMNKVNAFEESDRRRIQKLFSRRLAIESEAASDYPCLCP